MYVAVSLSDAASFKTLAAAPVIVMAAITAAASLLSLPQRRDCTRTPTSPGAPAQHVPVHIHVLLLSCVSPRGSDRI